MLESHHLPAKLADMAGSLPTHLLDMSVDDLEKSAQPTLLEKRLRNLFWIEAAKAVPENRPIDLRKIIRGIYIVESQFYRHMGEKPAVLLYILTPPASYEERFSNLMDEAFSGMQDYIKHFKLSQADDFKTATTKMRVLMDLSKLGMDRLEGAPVARQLIKTVGNPNSATSLPPPSNADEVEHQIRLLEAEKEKDLNELMPAPQEKTTDSLTKARDDGF